MVFSLFARPGTVGAAADPPKSPANWIFPLVVASASTIVAEAICVSTYVFTAFWVGYKSLLVPRVVTVDLFAKFSLVSKAVWVAVEIGLFKSVVLSTLDKPKLALAPISVIAPVPPLVIGTVPDKYVVVSTVPSAFKNCAAVPPDFINPFAVITPLVLTDVIALFPNCILLLVFTEAPLPNAVALVAPAEILVL